MTHTHAHTTCRISPLDHGSAPVGIIDTYSTSSIVDDSSSRSAKATRARATSHSASLFLIKRAFSKSRERGRRATPVVMRLMAASICFCWMTSLRSRAAMRLASFIIALRSAPVKPARSFAIWSKSTSLAIGLFLAWTRKISARPLFVGLSMRIRLRTGVLTQREKLLFRNGHTHKFGRTVTKTRARSLYTYIQETCQTGLRATRLDRAYPSYWSLR